MDYISEIYIYLYIYLRYIVGWTEPERPPVIGCTVGRRLNVCVFMSVCELISIFRLGYRETHLINMLPRVLNERNATVLVFLEKISDIHVAV